VANKPHLEVLAGGVSQLNAQRSLGKGLRIVRGGQGEADVNLAETDAVILTQHLLV
jgi:hypothetical protein